MQLKQTVDIILEALRENGKPCISVKRKFSAVGSDLFEFIISDKKSLFLERTYKRVTNIIAGDEDGLCEVYDATFVYTKKNSLKFKKEIFDTNLSKEIKSKTNVVLSQIL